MNGWLLVCSLVIVVWLITAIAVRRDRKKWHERSKTEQVINYIVMALIFFTALTGLVVFALH